ncbi:MAG: hypothetical protein ACHP84_10710 [Caulobacterales bacterium]
MSNYSMRFSWLPGAQRLGRGGPVHLKSTTVGQVKREAWAVWTNRRAELGLKGYRIYDQSTLELIDEHERGN